MEAIFKRIYVILLQMMGSTRAELVRERLQTAFADCGLLAGMLMDHGITWWSPTAATGLRTHCHESAEGRR